MNFQEWFDKYDHENLGGVLPDTVAEIESAAKEAWDAAIEHASGLSDELNAAIKSYREMLESSKGNE